MNNQLKKGVIELVILELLSKTEMYGYQVASYLDESIRVKESSIYIILSRLQQNGYLSTTERHNGRKVVKYYKTTTEGEYYLGQLNKELDSLNQLIQNTRSINE